MVKFAPKLMFGTGKTDLREDINFARMREERAQRMKAVLKCEQIPVVLVTHEPNVRYLTGFSWAEFMTYLSYALFFAEGRLFDGGNAAKPRPAHADAGRKRSLVAHCHT